MSEAEFHSCRPLGRRADPARAGGPADRRHTPGRAHFPRHDGQGSHGVTVRRLGLWVRWLVSAPPRQSRVTTDGPAPHRESRDDWAGPAESNASVQSRELASFVFKYGICTEGNPTTTRPQAHMAGESGCTFAERHRRVFEAVADGEPVEYAEVLGSVTYDLDTATCPNAYTGGTVMGPKAAGAFYPGTVKVEVDVMLVVPASVLSVSETPDPPATVPAWAPPGPEDSHDGAEEKGEGGGEAIAVTDTTPAASLEEGLPPTDISQHDSVDTSAGAEPNTVVDPPPTESTQAGAESLCDDDANKDSIDDRSRDGITSEEGQGNTTEPVTESMEEPAGGLDVLLVEPAGVGRPVLWSVFNDTSTVPSPLPGQLEGCRGDGLIARRGYGYAAIGWQCDLAPSAGLLGIRPGAAPSEQGLPVATRVHLEIDGSYHLFAPPGVDIDLRNLRLCAPGFQCPRVTKEGRQLGSAQLYERPSGGGLRVQIPPNVWRWGRMDGGGLLDDPSSICRLDGKEFKRGYVYELSYLATGEWHSGLGLAALRDVSMWLRKGAGGIMTGEAKRVCAVGIHDSGRALNSLVCDDFVWSSDGTDVFDGMFIACSGAARGQYNQLSGVTTASPNMSPVKFPHATTPVCDEAASPEDTCSLLDRIAMRDSPLRLFYVNTAAEYHRGDGSLLHTSPDGCNDVPLHDNARVYFLSGCATSPFAAFPPSHADGHAEGYVLQKSFSNPLRPTPLLRGLLVAMCEWLVAGTEPPMSRYPTLKNGSLVYREDAYSVFDSVMGSYAPTLHGYCFEQRCDGSTYGGSLVPAPDAFGIDRDGVALPSAAVPSASLAGWATRHAGFGFEGSMLLMAGTCIPLLLGTPHVDKKKKKKGWFGNILGDDDSRRPSLADPLDPRPVILSLYPGGRDDYAARCAQHADTLVDERWILPEDRKATVEFARNLYEWATSTPPPVWT